LRSNVDKHITLCELVHKSKRNGLIVEEDIEVPSLKKMYKMLLELGKKYNILEEKVEEINKFVIKKKKKINVLEWLNANVQPPIIFEKLHEQISINDEDISYLLNNSFNDTLNGIFNRSIYNVSESEYPIFAFTQKANMFYVYDKNIEEKLEWQELTRVKLVKFLNKVHLKIAKYFNDWKKKQINEIKENDSFATICDKTLVKLMSVEFKHDYILSKTRSSMYSKMKTDMKAFVEYEFEF